MFYAKCRNNHAVLTIQLSCGRGSHSSSSFQGAYALPLVIKLSYNLYSKISICTTGMDWNCPAFNEVLGRQLTKYHGNITVENTIRDVVSIVQTGNLQVALYDLTKNVAYLANAKASYESGPQYAYERYFLH